MIERTFKLYRRPLVQDTVTTTIWSTIGKAVGFLIPFFIAAWFGVSTETDAFFFAYGLILFLSGIFAPVVESVIVPYIAEARVKGEDVGKFVGNILCISGVGLFVLTVLLILVIKPILSIITHFDEQTLRLIYQLLIETAPLIILLVWTSVLAGALNTYKRFAVPAISPAFRAVVNLIIIFTFKDVYGIHSIALGYVVGELIRLAVLVIVTKRLDLFKLRFSLQIESTLLKFFKTASYQIIGMAAVGLNPFIDKIMASWLGEGSVSILHYAVQIYVIPTTFMTTGLMVVLLSHWSDHFYSSGTERLKSDVIKTVRIVGFLTVPLTAFLLLFRRPIVELAFGRGEFDKASLPQVASVLGFYLLGFLPYMMGSVFLRAHLVLKNTKVLMRYGLYAVALRIALDCILIQLMDVNGIALASALTVSFFIFYLRRCFYREVGAASTKALNL